MQCQRVAFLQDIAAHSRDDAPRLIYADWLDERGDEQGEFIRVQCELASNSALDVRRRNELKSRELQLIRQFAKGWTRPIRGLVKQWHFERGMVTGIRIDTATFLQHGEELLKTNPVLDVDFINAFQHLAVLSMCDLMTNARSIGFPYCNLGFGGSSNLHFRSSANSRYSYTEYNRLAQAFQAEQSNVQSRSILQVHAFFERARLHRLKRLRLTQNFIGDEGLALLCNCVALSQLESLDLRVNGLSSVGVEALLRSHSFSNLRELVLGSCKNVRHYYDYNNEDHIGPLTACLAELIPRLKRLDASECDLTQQSLAQLNQTVSSHLERLSLRGNGLWDATGREDRSNLLQSPLLLGLRELNLDSCYLTGNQLQQMLQHDRLHSLNELSIANNPFGPEAGQALAKANLPSLCQLILDGQNRDNLTDEGMRPLLQSTSLPNLSVLSIRQQKLTDASIEALLESPFLQQLHSLDFSDNELTDHAAERLVIHGPWQRLASINVRRNKLSPWAKDQLQQRFGYRVLY